MTGTDPIPRMPFIQPVAVGLAEDPDGGLRILLHGGAHAHMPPGVEATKLARAYGLTGVLDVAPPFACRCSYSAPES